MTNIHALLVGINDYSPEVGALRGCVNDVGLMQEYLRSSYKENQLRIETLTDADATRDNIISQFRNHLAKAGESDVVLFQFAGHGARWSSADEFRHLFPDGKDEGLVCYDSRKNGQYDLADKELAVLLAEVAAQNPHITVLLDCCHSGS
ncbi:MAG: caspase family protein, partial [Pseudomonadales bacterium]